MNFKYTPLLILFLSFSISSFCQEYKWRTERLVEKSKDALYQRNWDAAVEYMEDAIEIEPGNHHLYLERATLFYGINDINKVVHSLQKAFALEKEWPAKLH